MPAIGLRLFKVYRKPDTLFGMLLATLIGRSADSLIVNDRWCHFRRGRFVDSDASVLAKLDGYTAREMIGSPWGMFNNCLTV